ncbi:GNAT family N-acetyltransferase [Herbidospora mongoliensis]|uniref:GNAT family N-acetyltransferase n=1 Tax=Herbidospora mongoliensis TaxID=688067 RepID=UPI00082DB7CD|nr:GNAT family N-acetyltransferase [Herbidospora mongoliensis]
MELTRPKPADAQAIYDLIADLDTIVVGQPDSTLDDIADLLADPDFDPATDGWLCFEDGRLTGFGQALRKGRTDEIMVDVRARSVAAAEVLWEQVLGRFSDVTAEIGVYAQDTVQRAAVESRGFAYATSFHRMRIDHAAQPEVEFLPGVTVEAGAFDKDSMLRDVHRVLEIGFAEHFGAYERTYDEWYESREASSSNDWGQMLLARVHGKPAAALIGTDNFVPDENCGYVLRLAVLPEYRGRGLGGLLLSRAFAADFRRGRVGTILDVDSNNVTPALGLYTSMGMRPYMTLDIWKKRL